MNKKDRKIIPWECTEHRFKKIKGSNFRSNRNGSIVDFSHAQSLIYRKEVVNDVLSCCPGLNYSEVADKYLLFLEFYYLNPYMVKEMGVCARVDFYDNTYEYVDEVIPLLMDPFHPFYLTEVPMNSKGFFTARGATMIFDSLEEIKNIESVTFFVYGIYPKEQYEKETEGLITCLKLIPEFKEITNTKIFRLRAFAMPNSKMSMLKEDTVHPDFQDMVAYVPARENYDKAFSVYCLRTPLKDDCEYTFYQIGEKKPNVKNMKFATDVFVEMLYEIYDDRELFGTTNGIRIDNYVLKSVIIDNVYDKPYLSDEVYSIEELKNIKYKKFNVLDESFLELNTIMSVTDSEIKGGYEIE